MVFFAGLHRDGLDLCAGLPADRAGTSEKRLSLAADRRAIYTAGGIIYALKLPIFNATHKNFGSHEIFHLFVMGGSLCHYVMMYAFVA